MHHITEFIYFWSVLLGSLLPFRTDLNASYHWIYTFLISFIGFSIAQSQSIYFVKTWCAETSSNQTTFYILHIQICRERACVRKCFNRQLPQRKLVPLVLDFVVEQRNQRRSGYTSRTRHIHDLLAQQYHDHKQDEHRVFDCVLHGRILVHLFQPVCKFRLHSNLILQLCSRCRMI